MTDKLKSADDSTMALQGETLDGTMLVGIWNLHVRITCEDGHWFAQAYEIDYAACGSSLEDVKQRFQSGLATTVHEHLTLFGTIENLLTPAPIAVWHELKNVPRATQHSFSQIGKHELFTDLDSQAAFPFNGIEYSAPVVALA